MDPVQKRIDRAWRACKDWVTEFDGSPSEAYLANVKVDGLELAFTALERASQDFRVSTISAGEGEASQFIPPQATANHVTLLQQGQISGLNINLTAPLEGFLLDLHLILETLGSRKVDLEIVWWPDQVFPEEAEPRARFDVLLGYFISLQILFNSAKLYVGPETLEKPGPGSLSWIEV